MVSKDGIQLAELSYAHGSVTLLIMELDSFSEINGKLGMDFFLTKPVLNVGLV